MSDYTKLTNFAVKDALETGDPAKLILGEEIDDEFNAIATAVTSKLDADADEIGAAFYPQTTAELAAGVTPVVFKRRPGDLARYGFATGASAAVNASAFNNALASNSYVFCDDPGTYLCSDVILVQSNQTVRLAQGVVVKASVKSWAGPFIHINGKTNVSWYGGVIDGNKADNPTGVVFGMLIRDSSEIKIVGVTARNCPSDNTTLGAGGDGFYIGGNSDPGSVDIDLIGCHGQDNVRQGLSIVRGERISVIGGSYEGTTGNNPGAGIDIEANDVAHNLKDINISGVRISGCYYGIIFTVAGTNITCTGCTITDCRFSHVYFADCSRVTMTGCVIETGTIVSSAPVIDAVSAENVIFTGNYVRGLGNNALEGAGFRVLNSCANILISNNTFEGTQTQGVTIGSSAITVAPSLIRVVGNTFLDCVHTTAAAGVAVINVSGNSGSSVYPLFVHINGNTVFDSRSGGNEADTAINVATAIPAAEQSNYRVSDNFISGPGAVYTAGAFMPMTGGVTWNPGDLADGAGETSPDITVTGAVTGDAVEVYPPYVITDCICTGYVKSSNTVVIRLQNESGSANFNGASGTWRVRVRKLNQS